MICLGDQATIAMILYANVNHPNLKNEYPNWTERIKQDSINARKVFSSE